MGRRTLDTNTILFPSLRYVSSPLDEKGHRHTVTLYSRGPVPERIRPGAVRDSRVRLQQDEPCVHTRDKDARLLTPRRTTSTLKES